MYAVRLSILSACCVTMTAACAEFRMSESASEVVCSVNGVCSVATIVLLVMLVRNIAAQTDAIRKTNEAVKAISEKGVNPKKSSLKKQLATLCVMILPACGALIAASDQKNRDKNLVNEGVKVLTGIPAKAATGVLTTVLAEHILPSLPCNLD